MYSLSLTVIFIKYKLMLLNSQSCLKNIATLASIGYVISVQEDFLLQYFQVTSDTLTTH